MLRKMTKRMGKVYPMITNPNLQRNVQNLNSSNVIFEGNSDQNMVIRLDNNDLRTSFTI